MSTPWVSGETIEQNCIGRSSYKKKKVRLFHALSGGFKGNFELGGGGGKAAIFVSEFPKDRNLEKAMAEEKKKRTVVCGQKRQTPDRVIPLD